MTELGSLDGLPVEALRERCGVPALHVVHRTQSTNDDLRALAEQGAPAWTTIVADYQLAGRGRSGQSWHAAPGESLLFSTLVRYAGGASSLTAAPVRAGLRVARAIEQVAGAHAMVKWPNDVYLDDRKVAGILCEGAANPRTGYIVVGIGINVAQQQWPDDLPAAVSLLEATGRLVSRADLLATVLAELRRSPALPEPLIETELVELHARDFLRERHIAVDDAPAGVANGITTDGELRVITAGERTRLVRTGSVRVSEP